MYYCLSRKRVKSHVVEHPERKVADYSVNIRAAGDIGNITINKLSNIVGGGIFVGSTYWLVYVMGQSKKAAAAK